MADPNWRTNPHIQEAKRVTTAYGATATILIVIDEQAETIRLATYGTTGTRCREAERLGAVAYNAVVEAW